MATDDAPRKSKWLFLIPTEFERDLIVDSLTEERLGVTKPVIEICGFGPVVPAAQTVRLIQKHQPDCVLLMGIAGSYDQMLDPGTAFSFSEVACYGVGVGSAGTFQTAQQMGWNHWSDDLAQDSITDSIALEPLTGIAAQLLTVCAAAGNQEDVGLRLQTFPNALAEDMEGFAVAAACKLCNVPLSIVRGISNRAGDRDKRNWKIRESLLAAIELFRRRVCPSDSGPGN